MSHTATVKTTMKDLDLLEKACKELGLHYNRGLHSVKLYSESVNALFSVNLPGWNYPIAITDDDIKYDNYNGSWGNIRELTKLQNEYSAQATIDFAQSNGYQYDREVNDDEIIINMYDYS